MMKTHQCSVLLLLVGIAMFTCFKSFARQIESWSFERLFKESDLIVIAQPVKSIDSTDRLKIKPWENEFLGIITTFTPSKIIKGKLKTPSLTVLHYKTNALIQNGPSLVSFRTKGISYTITAIEKEGKLPSKTMSKVVMESPSTYLLFLRKSKDGRYEPVSGQTDPSLSVRELRIPMQDDFKK